MNARKLLLRERVEVRQLEEGLKGSWHPGVVVGVSDLCRDVRYDELLCESGNAKLIESIPVTGAIEGLHQRHCVKFNHRGRIRPIPPLAKPDSVDAKLSFGVCVDVLYREAWWEGVIFDFEEGAKMRRVFFPDEGDERVYKSTDLRVTSEWDEFTGQWRERGVWMLVNLAKEHKKTGQLFQFIRRVWSRLKVHYGFQKMISEWTCGAYSVWKDYFREVVCDMTTKPEGKNLAFSTTSRVHAVKKRKHRSKRSRVTFLDDSILPTSPQKGVEKDVRLAVRTRRMCMSEAEDGDLNDGYCRQSRSLSLLDASVRTRSMQKQTEKDTRFRKRRIGISEAEDGHVTNSHGMQSALAGADACINSDFLKLDDNSDFEHVTSQCCGSVSDRLLDEEFYRVRTSSSVLSTNPHLSENCKKRQNSADRRKHQLSEDKSTSEKLMPSPICGNKLERNRSFGSIVTRHHDRLPMEFKNNDSALKGELVLLNQKEVGVTMNFPFLRKGKKIRLRKRNIVKKRSPRRIKKIYPRKNQKPRCSNSTLKPEVILPQKEGNVLGSHCEDTQCEDTQPVIASCQEHGPQDTHDNLLKQRVSKRSRDSVCLVCQYGGELLHCDRCMSSYHFACIDFKETPVGESLCPSCQCGLCGLEHSAYDDQSFTQVCYQCSRRYHSACLKKVGSCVSEDSTVVDKFCSRSCFEICARLHELLQISNPTAVEGLTWTVTRSRRNDCNVHNERIHPLIQVSQVLNVFRECFEPIIEPHTGRNLVADIVYNSGSKFRRLDFHGFYVIALVSGEELVCVATIRIHGQKVAEMPLVATRFKYRRKGMCRILVDELEKMLVDMGVERLVLPAIAQLSDTWVSSFGFADMPAPIRRELLGYPFVFFQGTTMFQKILRRSAPADSLSTGPRLVQEKHDEPNHNRKRFSLHYKRRRSPKKPPAKKKTMTEESDKNQQSTNSTYKLVYKRRRIQASRDSIDSQ